jgi:hypothetical protein
MPIPFTPESALKAREQIEVQKSKYKAAYMDDEYWTDLAWARGVRMPPYYTRPSDQDIKFWLKLAKVSYTQFVESFGWKDAEAFERLNPNHGMKILAGMILELGEENLRLKKMARERVEAFDATTGDAEPPKSKGYQGKSKERRRAELAKSVAGENNSLLPR